MKLFYKNNLKTVGLVAAALILPQVVFAQTITETQALDFGTIAIHSYAAVGRVTISPSGTFSYNANVSIIEPPQLGEYTITGAPASAGYSIVLPASVNIAGPGGPFVLDNLEYRPLVLLTDPSGNDEFTISGRLQTLGGGTPYGDGTYTTMFTVTVAF